MASKIGNFLDKAANNPQAVKELKKMPAVLECRDTTGHWSILITVICKVHEHLIKVLNEDIQVIANVSRTEIFISLEQQIEGQIKF